MTHRLRSSWAGALVLSLCIGAAGRAHASPEGETPSAGDQAIEKGRAAMALFERGKWHDARALFEEADALFHSPVLVLYQARALRNLGRVRDAKRVFERLASEPLLSSAPPQWQKAQADGAQELSAMLGTAPYLLIEVEGSPTGVQATFDDAPIDVGVSVLVDPGEHRVRVTLGETKLERTVTLRLGQPEQRQHFRLPSAKVPATESGIDGFRVLGAVLTSVGGASLIAGGVMGGLALQKSSEAKAELPLTCTPDLHCREDDEAVVEARFATAYQYANAADGLLIAGGVTAAAGILVLIIDPGGKRATPTAGGLALRF